MKVMITGAAGFVGAHVFERLVSRGYEVAGVVRGVGEQSPSSARRIAALDEICAQNSNAQLIRVDIASSLNEQIPNFKPDACVHLAGRSSVRESLQNPGLYESANGQFSMRLLEALRLAGCRRVVHASTVMVYGKDAPRPYREDAIGTMPASFYGASKLAIETQMNTWRALHGMETVNLRLFSTYGPGLRADCVPHLIASAIVAQRAFNVFGDGSSVRDYVAVEDVVEAIELSLSAAWRSNFPLALNIGSGVGTRLIDLIRMLERGLRAELQIEFKPAVAGELAAITADVSAAQRELNWSPSVKIDAGMLGLTDWFRTQTDSRARD